MKGRIVPFLMIFSLALLCAPGAASSGPVDAPPAGTLPASGASHKQPQDSVFDFLGGLLTLPMQVTYKMFAPLDVEDLSTMYRKRGFTPKDQDYFQLNWYGEQRAGYDELFERKELEEEIQRETYGPNR